MSGQGTDGGAAGGTISLWVSDPDRLKVREDKTRITHCGCNQAWYATEWQQRAGCGPSVASTLFFYVFRLGRRFSRKRQWLALMEDVWGYVTPTPRGMPDTRLFCDSVLAFAAARGWTIVPRCCDVPEEKEQRPDFSAVVRFIADGLRMDVPVAFLNLCNGEEQALYRWHWVTVVGMDYARDCSAGQVHVLDEGLVKKIDLALWHQTTTLGGGFVYFTPAEPAAAGIAEESI